MADDIRSHAPTERKLARLWRMGVTPASPALVGAGVLAVAWIAALLAAPALSTWAGGLLRGSFEVAGSPESILPAARAMVLQASAVMATLALAALAVAIVVQAVQAGPRGAASAGVGAGRLPATSGLPRPSQIVASVARALPILALGAVAVAMAVRAALLEAERLMLGGDLPRAAASLAASIGWPLLLVVLAAAALDAIIRRAMWLGIARMSRRELEEEMRETEGHPLTRRRRDAVRRRAHA